MLLAVRGNQALPLHATGRELRNSLRTSPTAALTKVEERERRARPASHERDKATSRSSRCGR